MSVSPYSSPPRIAVSTPRSTGNTSRRSIDTVTPDSISSPIIPQPSTPPPYTNESTNGYTSTITTNNNTIFNNNNKNQIQQSTIMEERVSILTSSEWKADESTNHCSNCHQSFHKLFSRRHHCRLCGLIFCHACTSQKALLPPSSIVLHPKKGAASGAGVGGGGGRSSSFRNRYGGGGGHAGQPLQHQYDEDYGYVGNTSITNGGDDEDMVTVCKRVTIKNESDTTTTTSTTSTNTTGNTTISTLQHHDNSSSTSIDNDLGTATTYTSSHHSSSDKMNNTTTLLHDSTDQTNNNDVVMSQNPSDEFLSNAGKVTPEPSETSETTETPSDEEGLLLINPGEKSSQEEEIVNVGIEEDGLSYSVATSTDFSYMTNSIQPNTTTATTTGNGNVSSSQIFQSQLTLPELDDTASSSNTNTTAPATPQQTQNVNPTETSIPTTPTTPTHTNNNNNDIHSPYYPTHEQDYQHHYQTILYGKGLEERLNLAREPLRVCSACHTKLQPLQEQLRNCNANSNRYNTIDPTHVKRILNSPLAFTLGHEVRKAAYTLNNLLPMPRSARRLGLLSTIDSTSSSSPSSYPFTNNARYGMGNGIGGISMKSIQIPDSAQCQNSCQDLVGGFGDKDGVRIPAQLLEKAKGVAILTVVKSGLGAVGFEFGTGLVISRLPNSYNAWSPPCAIGMAGASWGLQVGVGISDHVLLLMTDQAVNILSSDHGSFQLGADVAIALGPIGRKVNADVSTASMGEGQFATAPIYSYSLSRGLYAGISLDGKMIMTRHEVNERFYGQPVSAKRLLCGEIPTPPAAQPLYDALKRCHAYATADKKGLGGSSIPIGSSTSFGGVRSL